MLQGTDAVVVADEVYEHIVFDGARHESLARYPEIADRAVVISSFGKTYHTTGWKVGYCAAPAPLTDRDSARAPVRHLRGQRRPAARLRRDGRRAIRTAPTSRRSIRRSATSSCALIEGSRFRPLPCRGTFFQMLDYSAITERARRRLRAAADHGARRRGDSRSRRSCTAPTRPGAPVLLRQADETLERAAERLRKV